MIIDKQDKDSVTMASDFLRKGKIVILPTDTVYGFSGIVDLKNAKKYNSDSKIRMIKGRSESKPLIQLISRPEDIHDYTEDDIPDSILDKWPGALTVIVHVKDDYAMDSGTRTVAFRCPGDEWLRKIISECGSPIYSTSVNRSGFPIIECIEDIKKEFEKDVELIVCDGDKRNSLPSTLVSLEKGKINVIRQGSVII